MQSSQCGLHYVTTWKTQDLPKLPILAGPLKRAETQSENASQTLLPLSLPGPDVDLEILKFFRRVQTVISEAKESISQIGQLSPQVTNPQASSDNGQVTTSMSGRNQKKTSSY